MGPYGGRYDRPQWEDPWRRDREEMRRGREQSPFYERGRYEMERERDEFGPRRGYGPPRRYPEEEYGAREPYGVYGSGWGHGRRGERGWDRDWDERSSSDETRALVEREDRGPLRWLGDKVAEAAGRRGRGPKGYKRSDERIMDDVCERFARSGLDASDLEVKVESSEVTLLGTVRSRDDKRLAEDVAEDVFGVEEVHNHLRVARPETSAETGAMHGRTMHH